MNPKFGNSPKFMPEKLKLHLIVDSIKECGNEINLIHLNPDKEISEGLAYVQEGIAKIYGINEKGLKINTDLVFQGEIFLVQNGNYQSRDNFYLEGLKYSKIFFLPLDHLSSIQKEFLPEIQMKFYNERLKRIHQQKVRNYDLELHERVFYLLFDFCLIFGKASDAYYSMPNFFTHDELSNILRNCRQNITACLNELKRDGIIQYNRKEIKIEKTIFEEKKVKYLSGLKKTKK
ncbi:cAMP-binding protein [Belliella baltica DSM 15883]|uniref:cAMP-binding protein n=2 Tax=Belliella TaxID=232244 RepID=I3Z7E6_BELBD|nr:cAMP-binding protein [Belliella baltica DSM 15883]